MQPRELTTEPRSAGRPRPFVVGTVIRLGPSYWCRAVALATMSGLALAIPTRLVPNDFFSRMTPTRPLDYVFWVASSVLLGLTLSMRTPSRNVSGPVAGGLGTFLAVGCPICNKVVVAMLGVSGALSYFAPLQPLLGTAALVLLVVTLRRRASALAVPACPIPDAA